jgi:hypothetical protein
MGRVRTYAVAGVEQLEESLLPVTLIAVWLTSAR